MENSTYSVYLMARGQLLQEGWRRLLRDTVFELAGVGNGLTCLRSEHESGTRPDLVIVDTPGDEAGIDNLARGIKEIAPEARAVFVLSSLSAEIVGRGFANGADGFLDKDISHEAMVESLRLVMLGQQVYPTDCLAGSTMNGNGTFSQVNLRTPRMEKKLSERELEILRCLIAGYPNKVIARRLHITDTTVKVHLKNILRKINLSNRTQAAIWAVSQGLEGIESSGTSSERAVEGSLHSR